MLRTDSALTELNWSALPIFTVSEAIQGYSPPGVLDGLAAFALDANTTRVLVNHEMHPDAGAPYSLANGTQLIGARISFLDFDRSSLTAVNAGVAYSMVYDRMGNLVTAASQINEAGNPIEGFDRLCSAQAYSSGELGFVDSLHFAGEETRTPMHPHGGTLWVLEIESSTLWGVPAVGRGAWENVTAIESGNPTTIALLLNDDSAGAPLYLYVGQKNAIGDGSFLDRNGLQVGTLHAWRSFTNVVNPNQFNGTSPGLGVPLAGEFVPLVVQDPTQAGLPGHDAAGYLDIELLQQSAWNLGAFRVSRPEDLHTDPTQLNRVVIASAGGNAQHLSDLWGTIYEMTVDFPVGSPATPTAVLSILHDADALVEPDHGIRSPDNLTWSEDGYIYVQEDRTPLVGSQFGLVSGAEASIWRLDPADGSRHRLAEIDRSSVLPADAMDACAAVLGCWESSGVIDVTGLFAGDASQRTLLAAVQAHGIYDGGIGGNNSLDEGGQLVLLQSARPVFRRGDNNGDGSTTIEDVFLGLEYLFLGGAPTGCADSLDTNDNGRFEIADAIHGIDYLFNAGAPPAAPFSTCGVDPTPDLLSCEFSPCP